MLTAVASLRLKRQWQISALFRCKSRTEVIGAILHCPLELSVPLTRLQQNIESLPKPIAILSTCHNGALVQLLLVPVQLLLLLGIRIAVFRIPVTTIASPRFHCDWLKYYSCTCSTSSTCSICRTRSTSTTIALLVRLVVLILELDLTLVLVPVSCASTLVLVMVLVFWLFHYAQDSLARSGAAD